MMRPGFGFQAGPAITNPNFPGFYQLTLQWTDVGGGATQSVLLPTFLGTTRQVEAMQAANLLNANPLIRADWTFAARNVGGTSQAQGTSNAGRNAQAVRVRVTNVGILGLSSTGEIDPLHGIARFGVTLDGTPRSSGDVGIGIAGINDITTPTTNPEGTFKDVMTIENDLLQGLRSAGFSDSFIDASGAITVLDVSTGDTQGTGGVDVGALFFTSAAGVGGFAEVTTIPEPAALMQFGIGLLIVVGTVIVRCSGA
jgi:hypothetical protein